MKALSTRNDDPEGASRPFDNGRDGFVWARRRGSWSSKSSNWPSTRRRILAELVGYGMSSDAYHMTGMAPEGEGCRRAMNAAINSAGISPDKIDYVNAHATGTPVGDSLESKAIENVFGERALNHTLLVDLHQVHDRPPAGRRGRASRQASPSWPCSTKSPRPP